MSIEGGGHPPVDGISGRTDIKTQDKIYNQEQADYQAMQEKFDNRHREIRDIRQSSYDNAGQVQTETNNPPVVDNQENKSFFSKLKDKFKRDEKPDDSKMNPDQDLAEYKKMQTEGDNYLKEKEQDRQNKLNPVASADSPKVYGTVDPEVQEMRDMNAQMDQYNQQKIEENKPPKFNAAKNRFEGDNPTKAFLNLKTESYQNEIKKSREQLQAEQSADQVDQLPVAVDPVAKTPIPVEIEGDEMQQPESAKIDVDTTEFNDDVQSTDTQILMPEVGSAQQVVSKNETILTPDDKILVQENESSTAIEPSEEINTDGLVDTPIKAPDGKTMHTSYQDGQYVLRIRDKEGVVSALYFDSQDEGDAKRAQEQFKNGELQMYDNENEIVDASDQFNSQTQINKAA